jgi:phosphomannomutase
MAQIARKSSRNMTFGDCRRQNADITPKLRAGCGVRTYLQRMERNGDRRRDNRHVGCAQDGAIAGLRASGCDVLDIGLSTPLVYWHAVQHDDWRVMVTSSHSARPERI